MSWFAHTSFLETADLLQWMTLGSFGLGSPAFPNLWDGFSESLPGFMLQHSYLATCISSAYFKTNFTSPTYIKHRRNNCHLDLFTDDLLAYDLTAAVDSVLIPLTYENSFNITAALHAELHKVVQIIVCCRSLRN